MVNLFIQNCFQIKKGLRPDSAAPAETHLGAGHTGPPWLLTVQDDLGSTVQLQVAQEVQQLLDGGLPHPPPPQQLPGDAHTLHPLH